MPYKSKAQVRKLFATNPTLARKWAHKYGIPKNLPERIGKKKRSRYRGKPNG